MSYRHPWLRDILKLQRGVSLVDAVAEAMRSDRASEVTVGAPTAERAEEFLDLYRRRHPGLTEPRIVLEKERP